MCDDVLHLHERKYRKINMDNVGKKFEKQFAKDFLRTLSDSTIDRLYDSVSGYKSIKNICDFIGYKYPNIYYLECKTHKGTNFPFDKLTQYEKLLPKVGIPGVRVGVVLWLYECDKVFYIPISTVTQIMKDGQKSFSLNLMKKKAYNIIEISSIKKRIFMESDYSVLTQLKDGE